MWYGRPITLMLLVFVITKWLSLSKSPPWHNGSVSELGPGFDSWWGAFGISLFLLGYVFFCTDVLLESTWHILWRFFVMIFCDVLYRFLHESQHLNPFCVRRNTDAGAASWTCADHVCREPLPPQGGGSTEGASHRGLGQPDGRPGTHPAHGWPGEKDLHGCRGCRARQAPFFFRLNEQHSLLLRLMQASCCHLEMACCSCIVSGARATLASIACQWKVLNFDLTSTVQMPLNGDTWLIQLSCDLSKEM